MDINQMARELTRDEAKRPRPYRDCGHTLACPQCTTGRITIGIGRNLEDNPLTEAEMQHLLHNDIEVAKVDLEREMPWTTRLDEVRFRVMLNMTFNMGISRLFQFTHFLADVEAGRYFSASREMLHSLWAQQVGVRALRLSKMMETGVADAE